MVLEGEHSLRNCFRLKEAGGWIEMTNAVYDPELHPGTPHPSYFCYKEYYCITENYEYGLQVRQLYFIKINFLILIFVLCLCKQYFFLKDTC